MMLKSYDLLTKSSERFKDSVFKLTKRMIEEEKFPNRFDDTKLQQLWKKKGKKEPPVHTHERLAPKIL